MKNCLPLLLMLLPAAVSLRAQTPGPAANPPTTVAVFDFQTNGDALKGKGAESAVLLNARLLLVKGTWQREGDVRNLIAGQLEDLSAMLGRLATESRDFK